MERPAGTDADAGRVGEVGRGGLSFPLEGVRARAEDKAFTHISAAAEEGVTKTKESRMEAELGMLSKDVEVEIDLARFMRKSLSVKLKPDWRGGGEVGEAMSLSRDDEGDADNEGELLFLTTTFGADKVILLASSIQTLCGGCPALSFPFRITAHLFDPNSNLPISFSPEPPGDRACSAPE